MPPHGPSTDGRGPCLHIPSTLHHGDLGLRTLTALAVALPPLSTALLLTGLIGLEAYVAVNTAAPPAIMALQALQRLRAGKTKLGLAEEEPCSVCKHQERRSIEEKVAGGASLDSVSEEYGLEVDELVTHTALHASRAREREDSGGLDIERELSRILEELKEMQSGLKRIEALFEAGELRIQDYLKLLAERRALMRDIRTLLIIVERARPGRSSERDLGSLLRRLRGLRQD
ncbi:MAG: hypothetical protein QW555_07405 [Nitrososphaerota archaeon]